MPKSRAGKWETKGASLVVDIQMYIASLLDQYETVAPRRDKSCGRVANKFGLRTWL